MAAPTEAPDAPAPRKQRAAKAPKAPKAQKTLIQEMSALLAKVLLPDLRVRARQPSVERALRQHWQAERDHKRTAVDFDDWSAAAVEQVGAAWILSCVFVRVLEDRGLTDRHRVAGEGADDSLQQFLEIAPSLTERDYLLTVFRELATYPGAGDVLDPAHNPAWRLSPSNDSVRALLALLRETGTDGGLRFRFESKDTRFLGDLYQDLSESVRKRYALLQTPDFIERFILDQTLEPAIAEFGLEQVRLIDPTCGSGHFVLGAFHRLFEHRQRAAPATDRREHAKAALAQVTGVDINPYAVAIARFRLTLAYLEHAGIDRLALAPRISTNLVIADSLLHGTGPGRLSELTEDKAAWGDQMFALDDPEGTRRVFGQKYHTVLGNPPYITCKDPVLREEYRQAYDSAEGKYALCAPFTERFFQLAQPGGFVGMINANSFMKREFGKALIEKVLPRLELTEVIDTSGAYIPGHGTPTVLLFGRNRGGVSDKVHAVMGKRGEPTTPEDAEKGLVWSAIASHHTEVGFENDYISIAEVPRETLNKHPWSLGGGGAAELKELLEERCEKRLGDLADSIGISSFTLEDDVYLAPRDALVRGGVERRFLRSMVIGEAIRDWAVGETPCALFPYDDEFRPAVPADAGALKFLWPYRTSLANNMLFGGKTKVQGGLKWFEYGRLTADKLRTPLSIAFAEVATHNHFVLDRGGKVFKQTAPIVKLPPTATEDDHLALLAYLNSSTACFLVRQLCQNKGAQGVNEGHKSEEWEQFVQRSGTALSKIPVPSLGERALTLARELALLAAHSSPLLREGAVQQAKDNFKRMVALQEDLDWEVYFAVGLIDRQTATAVQAEPFETLAPGRRPFEWRLLEESRSSGRPTAWFERNGYVEPIGAQPSAIADRLAIIARTPELQIIERPEFKRRWTLPDWYGTRRDALCDALLAECELVLTTPHTLTLRSMLARVAERPNAKSAIEELAAGTETALATLIFAEAVPFESCHVFTESGQAKGLEWERVWEFQRREDGGEIHEIPVPPKFDSDDYTSPTAWRLRGKLNVPKERFISYPGCERADDKSPLIGWAGWNHLQRAQALAALFQERKDQDGWLAERLVPILAGLLELVPWLKQWHNEPDPAFDGQRMGEVYEGFVSEKTRELQVTLEDLRSWRPETAAAGRKRAAADKEQIKAEMKAQKMAAKKAVTA